MYLQKKKKGNSEGEGASWLWNSEGLGGGGGEGNAVRNFRRQGGGGGVKKPGFEKWASQMRFRACSSQQFLKQHMKNKTIFFKKWPSTGRLDGHLAKDLVVRCGYFLELAISGGSESSNWKLTCVLTCRLLINIIIQLSYTVRIPIFWLADLYHMILGCDETTTLMSLSWVNSCGVNSTHSHTVITPWLRLTQI